MFLKKNKPSSVEYLENYKKMMLKECWSRSQKLNEISEGCERNWEKKIMAEAAYIVNITKGREALDSVIKGLKKSKNNKPQKRLESEYQVSSLFLNDCYQYLKADPQKKERIHLVTGTITFQGIKVLSRMEKLKYDKQSSVYVNADKTDSHKKIVSLAENYGHYVLAVFHSHMSKGVSSTTPSITDHQFMRRMAQVGCHCLGGIFSLDGYVRFFREKEGFDIDVYGKGVEKIMDKSREKIFKLPEFDTDEK